MRRLPGLFAFLVVFSLFACATRASAAQGIRPIGAFDRINAVPIAPVAPPVKTTPAGGSPVMPKTGSINVALPPAAASPARNSAPAPEPRVLTVGPSAHRPADPSEKIPSKIRTIGPHADDKAARIVEGHLSAPSSALNKLKNLDQGCVDFDDSANHAPGLVTPPVVPPTTPPVTPPVIPPHPVTPPVMPPLVPPVTPPYPVTPPVVPPISPPAPPTVLNFNFYGYGDQFSWRSNSSRHDWGWGGFGWGGGFDRFSSAWEHLALQAIEGRMVLDLLGFLFGGSNGMLSQNYYLRWTDSTFQI